ncbi:MAG: hypothetical protein QM669_02090 [Siphonobacter sp.]
MNGRISLFDTYQNTQVFSEYEVLKKQGIAYPKTASNTGGRTLGCTDWYLITTTYNGNGIVSTTSEYLGRTGDDECQSTRAGRTTCGGSGSAK